MNLGLDHDKRSDRKARFKKWPSIAILSAGRVALRAANTPTAVASGPRCVVLGGRELICTYMVQAALGRNDFCPVLARSQDGGHTWNDQGPLWPHLREEFSIFGSVSGARGELLFYGTRTPINVPGEPFWCDATRGLKANELIWARSRDGGQTWSDPTPIRMSHSGSAEAPGALCISRNGTWHGCYAPYNTFDPAVVVPRNQLVLVSSSDEGLSWQSTAAMRFRDELSTAAEAWIVELADGRLLATCWNMNQRDGTDYPNAYSLSNDGGKTWCPTRSTGVFGQTTALTPLPDGSALFVYCKRQAIKAGIQMARVRPTDDEFGVLSNDIIWEAPQSKASSNHAEWTQFTFGEPSATLLNDKEILLFFWCLEDGVGRVEYVRLTSTQLFF